MASGTKMSDEEKIKKNRRKNKLVKYNLKLKNIEAITENQKRAFYAYFGGNNNILLHGVAGTGKTFISMYFALSELMQGLVNKIIIIRSTVQSRDMGFMPGTEEEKLSYYELPYIQICDELFQQSGSYKKLKANDAIEFRSTSFMRGITLDETVVLIDEVQNMTDSEIKTVITRLGPNSRLIICGDFRQDDLKLTGKRNQQSGISNLIECARKMEDLDLIEFGIGDIVRSGFVKNYILTRINLGLD